MTFPSSNAAAFFVEEQDYPRKVEALHRSVTGTWLSPMEQPRTRLGKKLSLTKDHAHKKFITQLACARDKVNKENLSFLGEALEDTFKAYPIFSVNLETGKILPNTVKRSTQNAPVKIPWEILPETVIPKLTRNRVSGEICSSSLRYSFLERGYLRASSGDEIHRDIYTYQIRHHTKLEVFHEIRRPVYCVNLKTDVGDLIDLRLIAILHIEFPFLEAAAKSFLLPDDSFAGQAVIDQNGRVFIDERIIRRAAFRYGQYQQELYEKKINNGSQFEPFPITEETFGIPDDIRHAHFLIHRAHLPEFSIVGGHND